MNEQKETPAETISRILGEYQAEISSLRSSLAQKEQELAYANSRYQSKLDADRAMTAALAEVRKVMEDAKQQTKFWRDSEGSSHQRAEYLQRMVEELERGMRAIIEAPGGGPAKRIATLSLAQQEKDRCAKIWRKT